MKKFIVTLVSLFSLMFLLFNTGSVTHAQGYYDHNEQEVSFKLVEPKAAGKPGVSGVLPQLSAQQGFSLALIGTLVIGMIIILIVTRRKRNENDNETL